MAQCESTKNHKAVDVYLFTEKKQSFVTGFKDMESLYFIPVFSYEHLNIDNLCRSLKNHIPHDKNTSDNKSIYSSIVITSPRAVDSLSQALLKLNTLTIDIPIFTFGSATMKKLQLVFNESQTKLVCLDAANDAKSMVPLIIDYLNPNNNNNNNIINKKQNDSENSDNKQNIESKEDEESGSQILPILCLMGERHRMEFFDLLKFKNIAFEKLIVYRSIDIINLDLPQNFKHLLNQLALIDVNEKNQSKKSQKNIGDTKSCLIFLSGNGSKVFNNYLKFRYKMTLEELVDRHDSLIIGAFGNTTAECLKEMNVKVHFVPPKPNANTLYETVVQYIDGINE